MFFFAADTRWLTGLFGAMRADRGRLSVKWQVYIILCSDNSLYTGITTEIERRFRQHREGRGAKYFRGRKPLKVVYLECGHTRSTAGRRESIIKALPRAGKALLLGSSLNEIVP
jgi:putative endonuclease